MIFSRKLCAVMMSGVKFFNLLFLVVVPIRASYSPTFSIKLAQSRCQAECLHLYGAPSNDEILSEVYTLDSSDIHHRSKNCSSIECKTCSQPCFNGVASLSYCMEHCSIISVNDFLDKTSCESSCHRLYSYLKTDEYDNRNESLINDFRILCTNLSNPISLFLSFNLDNNIRSDSLSYFLNITDDVGTRLSLPFINSVIEVSGLRLDTEYIFQIYAVNNKAYVFSSQPLFHTIRRRQNDNLFIDGPSFLPVDKLSCTATLVWKRRDSNFCAYTARVYQMGQDLKQVLDINIGPQSTSLHLKNLLYNTKYKFFLIPLVSNQPIVSPRILTFQTPFNCNVIASDKNDCRMKSKLNKSSATAETSVIDFLSTQLRIVNNRSSNENTIHHLKVKEDTVASHSPLYVPNYSVWLFISITAIVFLLTGIVFLTVKMKDTLINFNTSIFLRRNPLYNKTSNVLIMCERTVKREANDVMEVNYHNLRMNEKLGDGEFGMVYRATLIQSKVPDTKYVAVKVLKLGSGRYDEQQFKQEMDIMKKLGNHPNVLNLIGYCTRQSSQEFPLCIVTELCCLGDLKKFLDNHRLNEVCISEDQFLKWSLQVARGMTHLHRLSVLHRDLACRNILLDADTVAKISDFGMSRVVSNNPISGEYQLARKTRLPFRWMAPECFTEFRFSYSSDVWSYGVLVWEMVTYGAIPYGERDFTEVLQFLCSGQRLLPPRLCSSQLVDIMQKCWTIDSNDRPPFSDLTNRLEIISSQKKDYLEVGSSEMLSLLSYSGSSASSSESYDF